MDTHFNPPPAWLDRAVFYQIYPQSYFDSNADGIGDIEGIRQKLPYLQSLGITAIWINPCFVSPFQDAGYDVGDYYKVDPRYGTNEDLYRLFSEAKEFGIRVLLDLVPGHTSIEHPWFQHSARHEATHYRDYYIWTDSAWKWDIPGYRVVSGYSERDASYITNFFYFQPALNYGFANPDPEQPWQQPVTASGPQQVRAEIRAVIKFWLDRGATGFRVDMAGSLVKADPHRVEITRFWQEIRTWLDAEYPEAVLVSEWGQPSTAIPAGFHMDFALPFGMPGYTSLLRKQTGPGGGTDPYGFSFFDSIGHGNIAEFLDDYLRHYQHIHGKGYIAIPTGNHDINPRISHHRTTADMELIFLFLMTMPGTPFIYYGDEIGLRTLKNLPSKEGGYGRTGSRTPMQWSNTTNAGFSTAPSHNLYLPVDPTDDRPNAADQSIDPESLLNRVRRLIALRQNHPALWASSDFDVIFGQPGQYPYIFLRQRDNERILIAINPANYPVEIVLPDELFTGLPKSIYGLEQPFSLQSSGWILRMPAISGGVYQLNRSH